MMGADAPIPPFTIGAAAPKGAPRWPRFPVFPETELAPPCRTEALRRGAPQYPAFTKVSWFGFGPYPFMLVFTEQKTEKWYENSGHAVPETLYKRDQVQDLLFLVFGKFAPFLDEPAQPDDMHTLLRFKRVAVMRPFE